ncbi:colorectal mutant cancer protein-like isoform X1 [Apostichopus japonicus]|uniref:colorectal mutant cancer protein-like isoform X1 n=1 Tax=Stichopus japonicus TaxID=307972 RepID=UPI003AB58701
MDKHAYKPLGGTSPRLYRSNADMLHLAALASLKGEILDLSSRLQRVTTERDAFEKKLSKIHAEKAKQVRETEDKLDQQAVRYEERITELHSVIAELNKKIDRSHGDVIREEDELSQSSRHSNMSNSGGSANGSSSFFHGSESVQADNSQDLSEELSRVVGGLEYVTGNRKEDEGISNQVLSAEREVEKLASAAEKTQQQTLQAVKDLGSLTTTTTDRSPTDTHASSSHNSIKSDHRRRSSLEQEICMLREENETLNNTMSMKEEEMQKLKSNLMAIRDEKERLRRKVKELQARKQNSSGATAKERMGYTSSSSTEQLSSPNHRPSPSQSPLPSPAPHSVNPSTGELSYSGSERRGPVAKIAERVRLKPSKAELSKSGERHVLGSELSHAVTNPKVAEHLVQTLQECSNVQEIFQTLSTHGLSLPEGKISEIEVEMERLNSKIEHLKSQNDLLQLSLEESKSSADRLTMLVGKYESNNTALQLAVNYSDQAIEAFESLLSLSQSEKQLLLANCRAAGAGFGESSEGSGEDTEDTTMRLKRVHEERKVSESCAKALLQRLDRSCGTMVCHMPGSALQPWEDLSSHSHTSTTSSTASSCDTDFSKDDEQRLKDYVQQLKNDRAAVRLTVMELQSVHIDPHPTSDGTLTEDGQKLDLENAVLMQELTALKEEKAELKAQYYLLDKEKKALELKLSSREAQEQAYLVQISNLKLEVRDQQDGISRNMKGSLRYNDGTVSDSGTPAITLAELSSMDDRNIPADMAEMMRRERKLKGRINELVLTLEKLQRSSEMRHQQSAEFVADLKRANSALVTAYEKAKKKHQSRLKKVEAQMMAMVERHDTQVRMLKQRIALLEENQIRPIHNETSL